MELEKILEILCKNLPISNFIKIRPFRADEFHADGRTNGQTRGHDEADSCYSQS
jgi:hypothetical protein